MEVILIQDVASLGKTGDVLGPTGYARTTSCPRTLPGRYPRKSQAVGNYQETG